MLATHQRQLIKNLVINIMYRRSHKLLYLTHVVRWRMYSAPIQVEKHSQVKMVQSTLHGTDRPGVHREPRLSPEETSGTRAASEPSFRQERSYFNGLSVVFVDRVHHWEALMRKWLQSAWTMRVYAHFDSIWTQWNKDILSCLASF